MDVALIQWPSDEDTRQDLARRRYPRLLLVQASAEPPPVTDPIEDWIRLPVSQTELQARVATLKARAEQQSFVEPKLSKDGVLVYRGRECGLTPLHGRLIRPMIERFGSVVGRDTLMTRGWPDGGLSHNNLDVTVGRLRRQVGVVGLQIRTVRSRGYQLCDLDDAR